MILYALLAMIILVVDQVVKYAVSANIALNTSQTVIPNFLSIANIRNDGAAWSLLAGKQWFFFIVSILALGLMIYYFYKYRTNMGYKLSITLMIAGTLGNFIDRLRFGYVVDMFQTDFVNFPIFNVADTALTVGVIILLIIVLKEDDK
ncbi:signal peptidase II [Dellaglioa sp. P0083]|uniref:signal peptidase II n=1 Tax=Dellaglioa kimchii TaxID=3344667 RepID=UPI0038D36646